jgi:hypothetical protein
LQFLTTRSSSSPITFQRLFDEIRSERLAQHQLVTNEPTLAMTTLLGDAPAPAPGERPILEALDEVGYQVNSLADLRQAGVKYERAIPILVADLAELTEPRALAQVVRTLSVPWAKPEATKPLIDLFRQVDDPNELGLRWTIGNALDVTWDDAHYEDLVSLAVDTAFGRSREMIVLGFARSRRTDASDVLISLLKDRAVNGHATAALRKLMKKRRIPEARDGLTAMLDDERTWVRKDAERAIATLD